MNSQDNQPGRMVENQPPEISTSGVGQSRGRSTPDAIYDEAEHALMLRIFEECHSRISAATADSLIPPELLAGLTANESGGNAQARRFEPGVFEHLKDVVAGRTTAYGSITGDELEEAERTLEAAKSPQYHARFLNTVFAAKHALSVSELREDALRALATSWGYTQVMGYHMIGRKGSVQDLCDPNQHYGYVIDLLHEFIREFRLDARTDFEGLFHCWNSGRPRGRTFDPAYVPNGLRRSAIYKELMGEHKASGNSRSGNQTSSSQNLAKPAGQDRQLT